jgi:phage tail tube protein FII
MAQQAQDRFGQHFKVGDAVSVSGYVTEINLPNITVVTEDVGAPGYEPLKITVNAKQVVKGS